MDVAANTSRKSLFISRASQMDRDIAKRVYRFFSEDIVLDYKESAMPIENFIKNQKENILEILNTADQLKYEKKNGIKHHILAGKTLGMIFETS